MTKTEWIEEIRTLLRDSMQNTVLRPWAYSETDLIAQIRSVLRQLRAKKVLTTAVVEESGAVTVEPSETEGLLVAYLVAERLLTGDLLMKLRDGELGVLFKAGSDIIDTKTAGRQFETAAARYRSEAEILLAIVLADQDGGTNSVFGDPATGLES